MIDTKTPVAPERILISKLSVGELVALNDEMLSGGGTYGLLNARAKFLARSEAMALTSAELAKLHVIENQLILRGVLHRADLTR